MGCMADYDEDEIKDINKLKTLKDINEVKGVDFTCLRLTQEAIKAEAIKWVKDCFCREETPRCPACERTIKMNNISEEDLK